MMSNMNRVWKEFLKNLAWPAGLMGYFVAVITGSVYLESISRGGGVIAVFVFLVLPTLAYLVRDMWLDAKEKVEQENERLMREIGRNR